ncbi:MAG TPA: penicillin-insensitive murein endopeptidase [Hyphomicrobiales bacterium]|nr:penicillin-insensitive murein endopeptidase [Hyphomicrobiales bacterium]
MRHLLRIAGKALHRRWAFGLMLLPALAPALAHDAADGPPAKELFGHVEKPAQGAPQAIGGYARGCLSGAAELPVDGPFHQAMRLSRNRTWGHPELVDFLKDLAEKANERAGWPGILLGDLAQPRGGPMLQGHASHQIGLDADIWLMPSPPRRYAADEREEVSAVSVIGAEEEVPQGGDWKVDPTIWTGGHAEVIKAAASDSRVARIFVHPAIKRALCRGAGNDRAWLRKVRPWYGHHYHFHVRLSCPAGSKNCENQAAPPPGDGCGKALDWWFSDAPYRKPGDPPPKPKAPLRMADLPAQCKAVYEAKEKKIVPAAASAASQ